MNLLKTVVELTEEKYSPVFNLDDLFIREVPVEASFTPAVPVLSTGMNALFAKDMQDRLDFIHKGVCPHCNNHLPKNRCVTRHGTR